jgi:hypothetical protein
MQSAFLPGRLLCTPARGLFLSRSGIQNETNEAFDFAVGLHRMAQRQVTENAVSVPPPVALAFQDAAGFELRDDFLHGAFGDSHLNSDVTESHFGISGQAEQDVGVVGEKRPSGRLGA